MITQSKHQLKKARRSLAAVRCSLATVRCSLAAVRCSHVLGLFATVHGRLIFLNCWCSAMSFVYARIKSNVLIVGMVGINEGLISAAEAAFGGIKVPKHILIANFKCVNFFPIYINKNLLKTEIFSHYRLYLLNKMLVKKSLIGS